MSKNLEEPTTLLKGKNGDQAILKGVSVQGSLNGTLARVQVEQRYWNSQKCSIEAVYTFPLPIGAVLLDMEVEIAGKQLRAQVVEKAVAEQRYEEAITDGDSPVMVQEAGTGLYAMNVGNLFANEIAVIRFSYALPLSWQGESLRFVLPTTIAPKYGNAEAAGLQPWQSPEFSTCFEYPFDFVFNILGALADCEIASPSHPVSFVREGQTMRVMLNGSAALDRDLVLTAKAASNFQSLTVATDGEGHVAFASLRIPTREGSFDAPLCLKVVIDCSGSMAGVSIAQARKAALGILNLLSPQDYFNVTLFGSSQESIFPSMVPGEHGVVETARQSLLNLDADMGGTEMGKALEAAYRLSGSPNESLLDWISRKQSGMQPTVLLITDGEIWDFEKIIEGASKSGHRVFTVGVGMSIAEHFVTDIAKATGGACELVAPQEGMSERILLQFHRLRQQAVETVRVEWDLEPTWQTPLPSSAFSGDTIQVFAGFNGDAASKVRITGTGDYVIADAIECPEMCRVGAYARMAMTDDSRERLRLALQYQLLSPLTNYLVVAEREEKSGQLPELVKVPQMQAAGWAGAGALMCLHTSPSVVSSSVAYSHLEVPSVVRRASRILAFNALADSGVDRYDIPAFLRHGLDRAEHFVSGMPPVAQKENTEDQLAFGRAGDQALILHSPAIFIAHLNHSLPGFLRTQILPSTLQSLTSYGLPDEIVQILNEWKNPDLAENVLVIAFLEALMLSAVGVGFERGMKRLIMSTSKKTPGAVELAQRMLSAFGAITQSSWGDFHGNLLQSA